MCKACSEFQAVFQLAHCKLVWSYYRSDVLKFINKSDWEHRIAEPFIELSELSDLLWTDLWILVSPPLLFKYIRTFENVKSYANTQAPWMMTILIVSGRVSRNRF